LIDDEVFPFGFFFIFTPIFIKIKTRFMNIVNLEDKNYPKLLKKIGRDAPKKLYYKGFWDEKIFGDCLAVVGSRHLTIYGKQVTEKLVTEIAASGITIVSGFMYGGDTAAHGAAVKAGGRTIAVMPCGIDLIHPEYQQELYAEILNNKGLIISEYKEKMQPSNWTYPRRNRIVAGLCQAILVVEAGLKSGSLITANFAKKFGRKIFAVPGPITSEVSQGTAQLLKEGADLAVSAKDILDFYKIKSQILNLKSQTSSNDQNSDTADSVERRIMERLRREPLDIDTLSRAFSVTTASLGVTLSLMQLRGLIYQDGPKYYPS